MKSLLKVQIDKRLRYLIQTLIVVGFIYLFAIVGLDFSLPILILAVLVIVALGSVITHFPNIKPVNFFVSILMPISVITGALLSFKYFPNLGFYFKLFIIFGFGFLYYLVSLMDNVFLVIQDRAEIIPLYRVAVTWSLILQVVIAIPLFAGIFKLNLDGIYQSLIIGTLAFVFNLYQLWALQFDDDAKNPKVGEIIFLSTVVFFLNAAACLMTSFLPMESFLRALFLASVLMFSLVYVSGHLKNEISKKFITQYIIYIIIFALIMIVFTP